MNLVSAISIKADEENQTASESPAEEPEADSIPTAIIPPETTGTPAEIWGKFFSQQKVPPDLVQEIVQKLHAARKYEHVIAAIEAALVHGQAQPWMYEILALTMEVEGRPKEEVDRALLSALDVGNKDFGSTMYLAAYLVRFGREARALSLYQEASRWDTQRSDPYVLGLRIARKLKDIDGIQWAVCGVVRYAWGGDYEAQQREAEHASADAVKILKERGDLKRLEAFQSALNEARQRDLFVRVDWSGDADLDLLIEEPGGESCHSERPVTKGGGRFLHDGFGPEQKNCYDSYLCGEGRSGDYKVLVRYIRGNVVANRATLTAIFHQGTPQETVRKMTLKIGPEDAVKTLSLEGGRLQNQPQQ